MTTTSASAADLFFTAATAGDWDGMRAAVADGAVFWQNVDGTERTVDQVIRYTGRLLLTGGFTYRDVRRLVAPPTASASSTPFGSTTTPARPPPSTRSASSPGSTRPA